MTGKRIEDRQHESLEEKIKNLEVGQTILNTGHDDVLNTVQTLDYHWGVAFGSLNSSVEELSEIVKKLCVVMGVKP